MRTKLFCFSIVFLLLVGGISPIQASTPDIESVKSYIEQGQLEKAEAGLQQIIQENPEDGEAHLLLGRVYEKKAEFFLNNAIEQYEKALKDEKVSLAARRNLARLLLQRGDYEKTVNLLSEAGKKEKDFEVLKLLGLSYFKLGRLTEALEKLEKAKSINPDDSELLLTLAKIYEDKKLYDDAISSYEKVVSMDGEKLSTIARERIEEIKQQRRGLTVTDIEDPEVRELILTSPEAEKYPQAGAAILLNEHEYIVKEDNTMVEKIHKLIKIFNVRGREKYGEIHIDYDSTYETVKVNYARTIKPDRTIVEVGKKDIKDIDRWAEFPLYSNAKVKVISMPEVVEGSIIEYEAIISTAKLLNEDDFQFRFGLQYFEPVLHHRLKLTIPKERQEDINIHYVRVKNEKPEITETENSLTYLWEIEKVPEIISEPNMPPWADISPFIMASSFKSWDEFESWWKNLSKNQPEPTPVIEKKVKEIIEGKETEAEKAAAIYHWVIKNIRYVGLEFGIAGFKPHSAQEVFNNKYGDCKDKSTLLIAMYKAAEIPAHYVLIGTREMGKLEEEIPMSQFNHAIVLAEVEGKRMFLDPTAETARFGVIPGADQEQLSLVFLPGEAKFIKVPLQPPEANKLVTRMGIKVHQDTGIEVKMRMSTSGATDMQFRSFKYVKPARREQIVKNWVNSMAPGAKLQEYSFSDLDDYTTPVRLEVTFSAPDYLKKAGDVYLLTIPGIEVGTGEVGEEKREYPIVFSTTSFSVDEVEIKLPEEFKVKHLPEGVHLELPHIFFTSSYRVKDGTILYKGKMRREATKITTSRYPDYKSFRERVSRESQKQVILAEKK